VTIRDYILRRLNQAETDLNVLARQTRIQFPSARVSFSYVRAIRNEWQKASALRLGESEKLSEREPSSLRVSLWDRWKRRSQTESTVKTTDG
jgi:hypothetical protein